MPACTTICRTLVILGLTLIAFPSIAAEPPKQPQWYEIATGVLAIPAALIGLAYSYLLLKKTRLESRKTELEIAEKERALAEVRDTSQVATQVIQSSENRLLLLLLLRFVVLYLLLQGWGLVEDFFELVFAGIFVGAQKLFSLSFNGWEVVPLVALQKLPKVVYWLFFFGLGWPLFKDVNRAMGINVREFLRVSSLKDIQKLSGSNDG
jgi:hypothetical protein